MMPLNCIFPTNYKQPWIVFISVFAAAVLINVAIASSRSEMDEELRKVALQNGIDPDNPKPGTVFITPPKLSDEEEGSQFMPARHRCDGCTVIAYQLNKRFESAEKNKKKGATLSEAEILTVTELVCEDEFQNYGLKNVQGTNMLSGDGLPAEKMSGMVEAGGRWVKRLQNICKEIMGEFDEEVVYSFYREKNKTLRDSICPAYCGRKHFEHLRDEF